MKLETVPLYTERNSPSFSKTSLATLEPGLSLPGMLASAAVIESFTQGIDFELSQVDAIENGKS